MERVRADSRSDLVRQLVPGPPMRCRGGYQGNAHSSNELHFLPVVVTAAEEGDLAGVDLAHLETSPQRAAVGPAHLPGDVVQVRVSVDIEDAQPAVEPPLLPDQGGTHSGVVAAQHDRKGPFGRPADLGRHVLDVGPHVTVDQGHVAVILQRHRVEQLGLLAHGRKDRGQLSELRRRLRRAGTIQRTAVQRHPKDPHVWPRAGRRRFQPGPGRKS